MDSGQSKRNHPKKPVNLTDDDVKKYLKDLKQKENILKKFDKLLKDISDFDVMTFRLEEEDVYTKYDHFMTSDICLKCLIPRMKKIATKFINSSEKPDCYKFIVKWKNLTKVIDKTIENYTNLRNGKDLIPISLKKIRCDIDYKKLLNPLDEDNIEEHLF
ncbi:uncharacterized protein [Rhodnius prolixus]|uniref:Uncharacterized protein n=1 Tax=Rhodnius prolixus TaxID=13249 RepID=T1I2H0_RHOPR